MYCAPACTSDTFLRDKQALHSFDNLCLTFKLKFPLDAGSNQTSTFQFAVVAKPGSGYIALALTIVVCTIQRDALNELLIAFFIKKFFTLSERKKN